MRTRDYITQSRDLQVYKVVDPEATSLTPDMMVLLRSRVEQLEERGCKSYQFVECPQVLQLDVDEMDARVEKLHKCGVKVISAPLIDLAKHTSPSNLAAKVRLYVSPIKGPRSGFSISI